MALRYVEVRLPAEHTAEVEQMADGHDLIEHSAIPISSHEHLHRFVLEADKVEPLADAIRSRFGDTARIVVIAVEATLPRAEPEPDSVPIEKPQPKPTTKSRISREELMEDVQERIVLNPVMVTMAAVSALVACIGLARDDTIALIGAMVIAPLLGPNVALALSTTLGDIDLGKRALRSGGVGILVSFAVALAYGAFFGAPDTAAIGERAEPDFAHMALALASGVAGGLAVTSGLPASLVGVMVAVALLPPLATGGMLLGSGQSERSIGAFILLGINLIAVNLAGVATFLAQGIRPVWQSEKEKAKKAARRAIIAWTILLAALSAGIWWVRGQV